MEPTCSPSRGMGFCELDEEGQGSRVWLSKPLRRLPASQHGVSFHWGGLIQAASSLPPVPLVSFGEKFLITNSGL